MPRHRREKDIWGIAKSCWSKKRFGSRKNALAFMKKAEEEYQTKMEVYRCIECKGWHLARSRKRRRKRFRKFMKGKSSER